MSMIINHLIILLLIVVKLHSSMDNVLTVNVDLEKSQRVTKIIRNHPQGTVTNVNVSCRTQNATWQIYKLPLSQCADDMLSFYNKQTHSRRTDLYSTVCFYIVSSLSVTLSCCDSDRGEQ